MDKHHKVFLDFFRRFVPITEKEFAEVVSHSQLVHLPKGEFLAKEGMVSKQLGFLAEGMARTYYLNQKGEEVTRRLAMEPAMIAAYESFTLQNPSRENLQTTEPSYIFVISKEEDDYLLKHNPKYASFRRKGIDSEFIGLMRYLERFIDATAETRYGMIMKMQPRLIARAPLQYIASLIGVTPTQLSRIRKKMLNQ